MRPGALGASRPALALAVALLFLALTAGAHAAAAPRVLSLSHVPLVAPAGARLSLTAKIKGNGRRLSVGLVLGDAQGSATGGVSLGRGATVSGRATRRVVVRGTVPATVALGELRTLLVCPDPAAAIAGKAACRRAARIATSGTSTQERVAGARLAGRLSSAQGVLFGLEALRAGSSVPAELRGDADGPGGEQAAIRAASAAFGSLPAAIRRKVLPYFVPPPVQGSAWHVQTSRAHAVPAGSARAAANCQGYDTIQSGPQHKLGTANGWSGVPTADGHAIVWYENAAQPTAKLEHWEATDRASALAYARVFPAIWKKLTQEFGQPQSDAKEACYHGPDGRLDVYVSDDLVDINQHGSDLAITEPYEKGAKFCTDRPAYILARPGLGPWALAHEFMHVLQFSHKYVTCADPIAWWDEGGATWAADFVYPDDNTEQQRFPSLVAGPLSTSALSDLDYDAWPFWMMLQRTQGTGVLRAIFAQLRTKGSVGAVDAAIPGGLAKQVPRFFLHAFNQSPIGDSGFEIPTSFAAWDHWSQTPQIPPSVTLGLGTLPADTLTLPSQHNGEFPALSAGAYHRVAIPDKRVRQLEFTNALAGKPGAHVDALLHLADGSWKLADWTASKTVLLCRDRAGEDVSDLVIVSTNAGRTPLGTFTHTLRAANSCGLPARFDGTWTRIYTWTDQGTFKQTISGTATLLRNPLFPAIADTLSSVPYDVQSATVTWTVSGGFGSGCPTTFSGSGTDTPIEGQSSVTTTDLQLENVTGRLGAPDPEPMPFYYSIRSAISSVDPAHDQQYSQTDCHGNVVKTAILLPYFELGYPNPFTPDAPQDRIAKSADARLLEGHRVWSEPDRPTIQIDDTWSFKGSG